MNMASYLVSWFPDFNILKEFLLVLDFFFATYDNLEQVNLYSTKL